jgi:hypothetical protein
VKEVDLELQFNIISNNKCRKSSFEFFCPYVNFLGDNTIFMNSFTPEGDEYEFDVVFQDSFMKDVRADFDLNDFYLDSKVPRTRKNSRNDKPDELIEIFLN